MRGSPLSGIDGRVRTQSEQPVLGRRVGARAARGEATMRRFTPVEGLPPTTETTGGLNWLGTDTGYSPSRELVGWSEISHHDTSHIHGSCCPEGSSLATWSYPRHSANVAMASPSD
jgi:hypothetical protein